MPDGALPFGSTSTILPQRRSPPAVYLKTSLHLHNELKGAIAMLCHKDHPLAGFEPISWPESRVRTL